MGELLDQRWPQQAVVKLATDQGDVLGGDIVAEDAGLVRLEARVRAGLLGLGRRYRLTFVVDQGQEEVGVGIAFAGVTLAFCQTT